MLDQWHHWLLGQFLGDRHFWMILCCLQLGQGIISGVSIAQTVMADNTLGTVVTANGFGYTISGGTSDINSPNLFHSFEKFSLVNAESAYFDNQSYHENIFARVTSTELSQINGSIATAFPANLYLINPNGIEFVTDGFTTVTLGGGDFIATTAASILFPNNQILTQSTTTIAPLLLISTPIGLDFDYSSQDIKVNSSFSDNLESGAVIFAANGLQFNNIFYSFLPFSGAGDLALLSIAPGSGIDFDQNGLPQVRAATKGSDLAFKDTRITMYADTAKLEQFYVFGNNLTLDNSSIVPDTFGSEGDQGAIIKFDLQGDMTFNNLSFLSTDNLGVGPGSDLIINARRFILDDGSVLSNSVRSSGNGGETIINAQQVELIGQDQGGLGSWLFVKSYGSGNSGGIDIQAENVILRDGAVISTTNYQTGQAGFIQIQATQSLNIAGQDSLYNSGLYAEVLGSGSSSEQGIKITTPQLILEDGAVITSSNFPTLALKDGNNTEEAGTGQPGDIEINTRDLRLFNGSKITTNANTETGGNIIINTGILLALNNSDITANAKAGAGGRIAIAAKGIFGTEFRDRLTPESDITATSDLGAEFNGVVEIITPNVDATSGLSKLPVDVLDTSQQIQATCAAAQGNSFAVVGRGGIPENPQVNLHGDRLWSDLQTYVTPSPSTAQAHTESTNPARNAKITPPEQQSLQPITGWQRDQNGAIQLISQPPPQRSSPWLNCRQLAQTHSAAIATSEPQETTH